MSSVVNALHEEITEIEALLEKWGPSHETESRWAEGLLEMCLFRRKQLMLAQSRLNNGSETSSI